MESSQKNTERAVVRRCLQLKEEDSFITRLHFTNLGAHTGLTDLELDIIFDALDTNNDGVILLDDLLYHSQTRTGDALEEIDSFPESAESAHWSSTSSSESEFSPIKSGQRSSLDDATESKSLLTFDNQNDQVIFHDVDFDTVRRHGFGDENSTPCELTHDDFSAKSSSGITDYIDDAQGIHFHVEYNESLSNESPQLAASNYQSDLTNNNGRKSDQMENQIYLPENTQAILGEYSPRSDIPNDVDFPEDQNVFYQLPTESPAPVSDGDLNFPSISVTNRDQSSALVSPLPLSNENTPKLQDHSYGGSRLNSNQTTDDVLIVSPHSISETSRKVSPKTSNGRNTSHFGRTSYYNSSDVANPSVFKANHGLDNFASRFQDGPESDESAKTMHSTYELNFNPNDLKVTKDSPSDVTIRPVHSYSRFKGERVCGVKSQQIESNNATTKSNKISFIHRHDSYSNTVDSLNRIIDKATDSIHEENPVFSGLASPETVYEYDSSKIFPTPPSVRKLRHKSRRHDNLTKRKVLNPVQTLRQEVPGDLDLLSKLSQEQVCELYQNLHGSENPELVSQFENILLNVIKDVRQYKMENERLEKTYRREKDEHDKHLRRMEEEMELQVQSVEERVRKQEKEKLESEKIDLRIQLDSEITMLQQNLKKLQQDGMNRMGKNQEDHLLAMKKRLEEIQTENRSLKSELTDAQTNLALVKTEMSTVKQQLDEKAYELEVENKTVEAYVNEQDSLRRQLQLLHEANKNLLDTNDNLREMLDTPPNGAPAFKRTTSTDSGASARSTSPNFPRKGSVMSDYIDKSSSGNRSLLEQSFQKEVSMMPRFLGAQCQCDPYEEDSIAEELGEGHVFLSPDSGHSTLRDINDANDDTETDSVSIHSDHRKGKRHRRHRSNLRVQVEEEPESHDEMDTDGEAPLSPDTELMGRSSGEHRRSASVGSRNSNRSHRSMTREESILSQSSRSSRSSMRRQLPAIPKAPVSPGKAARDPDRMYKIALAGDAAVGKSTFIVRLCKGKFVANLSSTLGVDFQTKMLEFDNNTTALQLWDTAGQERFRSIARTYFRRADGVLLLYDVTYERSFLNVRDWVATIEEGAVKKVPIMLVGNKTDVRLELEQQGRRVVKYEDGLKLSKELDALFIETSAKDGSNISEAVIELTRILRTNEDLEVQTVGMQLHNVKDKQKNSCCKFS